MIDSPIDNNNKKCILKKYSTEKRNSYEHWCIAPLLAAGIIGGAASLGSSIIGGSSAASAAKNANATNLQIARETNQANAALAQQQQNWNVDLWNMQNNYNTPAAQLQRYKDAGLNPNLIYGSGSGSSGNAGSISTVAPARMERASVQPVNYFQGVAQGLSQGLSAFLQSQQLSIQEKRAEADVTRTGSSVDLNEKRMQLMEAQIYSEQIRPELIAAQANKLNQDTCRQFVETAIASDRQIHTAQYYRQQVEAQAVAMKLNEVSIQKIAYELSELLPLRKEQLEALIKNVKAGTTLRELQGSLMSTDVDWKTADKIINAIGSVLSGLAKFK
ncbi:DNA pilot protein [Chifec microvirus UA13_27]|nr:DNA pilot protein [Chifec microvirus UA13_27]